MQAGQIGVNAAYGYGVPPGNKVPHGDIVPRGNIVSSGDIVPLSATHPSHFGYPKAVTKEGDFVSSFANALKDAFYKVNDLQNKSDELTKALAVRPDTVDIHDVTIAAERARMALLFTKSIVDRITQAYKELINVR